MCPAAANGVVAVKPTLGAVSQRGIVPIARSQDTAGPFGRSVADVALLLRVLTGSGESGAAPRESLAGLRIGVVRNYLGAGRLPVVESALAQTLTRLTALQADIVDDVNPEGPPDGAEHAVLIAEFRDGIGRYLAGVRRGPRTLDALVAFNAKHARTVMPLFGQELFLEALSSQGTSDPRYRVAIDAIAASRTALAAEFERRNLVALVAPVNAPAWRSEQKAGDRVPVSSSSIAAVSGFPSVVVPVAMAGELPLGVAIIGRPGTEAQLLEIAALVERSRGPFPEPGFLPSAADQVPVARTSLPPFPRR